MANAPIVAVGCHGQTVRHRPGEFDGIGYTIQLNAPALLAELTGIDVVADFRSRDVAAGGQGAPLVPAFHRAVFGRAGATVAVLNLGGIANLTVLGPEDDVIGFDCGPANTLLDLWCERSSGRAFDANGATAARGVVDAAPSRRLACRAVLRAGAAEEHGTRPLQRAMARRSPRHGGRARAAASGGRAGNARRSSPPMSSRRRAAVMRPGADELVVCGGGAFNADLMARLGRALAPMAVVASDARGLPADQVEATAFAWLARAFVERQPGNVPTATGAAGPRVLGALYPAR